MAESRSELRLDTARLDSMIAGIQGKASKLVRRTAFAIEADIKTSMRGPKTGRIYGTHQASAPGESPAIDTGALINSISTHIEDRLTATVSETSEYAPHLEFGTTTMAPRPHMSPAFEHARNGFQRDVQKLLE